MTKLTDTAVRLYDGMKSVLTGLGGSVDANASAGWYMRPLSQQDIDACFRTSWLGRKVHSIPPTDMVRPWRKWLAKPDQITAIEAEERRLGLRQKVRKALLWSRLYGGAAIILGVEGDDPSSPLEVDRIPQGGLSYIHVLTRYELTAQAIDMDPGSRFYGEPVFYTVNGAGRSTQLHPSRVVRFVNGDLPDNVAFGEAGWADPLLVSIRDALVNADGAQGHFAALPAKALTSTLTTPGLMGLVSTKEGEQKYIEKTRIAQAFKSMFNLNIVAGPARQGELGETWEDNQVSFANMAEAGTWFVQMVAGAADVPMTRLAGMSPGGMNSTGESDSANYWTMLDAGRELDLRPRMEMIDEALIRSSLGNRDKDIWFEWLPFEVDTESTRADNAVKRANAIKTLADSNAVPSDVLEKIAKGQIIDSGEYPGAEDAYKEYEAQGEIEPLPEPANENALEATTQGLIAQGAAPRQAANDAALMLADAAPMPLYINRPLINGEELAKWAKDNGLNPIDPSKMHVTIAYSKQPVDWMKCGSDDWGNEGVTVFGGPRMLERFGPEGKVIVLTFSSSRLGYRHEEIIRNGASWDWPEYQPHVTIDYDAPNDVDIDAIKPFNGELHFGVERFERLNENWADS